MAHFAKVKNDIVEEVIVVNNEVILDSNNVEQESLGITFLQGLYNNTAVWVQTSYNNNFRNKFAGVGHIYNATNDVFYESQPYPSWILNETIWTWKAPTPYPKDGKIYLWNEETLSWDEE